MEHDLRLGSPEPVDGLVIISHDEQIVLRGRQHAHDIVLELVNILELIHQNIPELSLPGSQDIRAFLQKLIAVAQHIVKVDLSAAPQPVVILIENRKKAFGITGRGLIGPQIRPFIFHPADLRGDAGKQLRLIVRLQLLPEDRLLKKPVFFFLPENIFRTVAVGQLQDLKKDRVKRAERHFCAFVSRHAEIPLLHFPGRRPCKGDNQNFSGIDTTDLCQIPDPPGQNESLPRSGSGQNQHGTVPVSNGLLLHPRQLTHRFFTDSFLPPRRLSPDSPYAPPETSASRSHPAIFHACTPPFQRPQRSQSPVFHGIPGSFHFLK